MVKIGSGLWSGDAYAAKTSMLRSTGKAFSYTSTARAAGRAAKAHDLLDPLTVCGDASPFAGRIMRESRDSDEHPEALPIAVIFDVTASMGEIPVILQGKLPELFGLLLRKGYVADPQILMGAVGDMYSDTVPMQMGQFESDNRIDDTLDAIYIERGGGGGNHESYADAAYYLAYHTASDAWDKRRHKGYVFLIGDERPYAKVRKDHIMRYSDSRPEADLDTTAVFAALQERYHVYYIFCTQGSYSIDAVLEPQAASDSALAWRDILGQNALILEDSSAVCETIAVTIGIGEGTIDLDAGLADLDDIGSSSGAAVGKALAVVGGGTSGSVVLAETPGGLEEGDSGSGVTRL